MILIICGVLCALGLVALGVLHTSAVQRPGFARLEATIEEQTGWKIEIEDPRFRLWPAKLRTGRISASIAGVELLSVEGLDARWTWSSVMEEPRRFDEIIIRGLEFDFRDPPSLPQVQTEETPSNNDPWRVVEVDRLIIDGRGGTAGALDLVGEIDGLSVEAGLVEGEALVDFSADEMTVERSDRLLELGSVAARVVADKDGVRVSDLKIDGDDLRARMDGGWSLSAGEGRADFDLASDLRSVLEFWDPNLVSGLDPSGLLELKGSASVAADGAIDVSATHHGGRLAIAGYDVDELSVDYSGGIPEIEAMAKSWGRARVSVDETGLATVHARLREAPVERVLAFAAPNVAGVVDGPLSLTGAIDGTVAYPFSLDTLSARVDLEALNHRGRAVIRGEGRADEWLVDEFRIDLGGMTVAGSGEIRSDGGVNATADLTVDDMPALKAMIGAWAPDLDLVGSNSGPISGHVDVTGRLSDPRYEAEAEWIAPVIADQGLVRIGVGLRGDMARADITTEVTVDEGIELVANGHVGFEEVSGEGEWNIEFDNLQRMAEFMPADPEGALEPTGTLSGGGRFSFTAEGWSVDGTIEAFDLVLDSWRGDHAFASFSADPDLIQLSKISLDAFGGTAIGSGSVGLGGLDSLVSGEIEWRDVDLGRIPAELPVLSTGLSDGMIEIDGTIANPTGVLEADWRTADELSEMTELHVAGSLQDGLVTFVSEEATIDAGAFLVEGELPVGLIPRPDWMWVDAPDGELRLSARGRDLKSDPIVELLGYGEQALNATADLDLEARWHPDRPDDTKVYAEFRDFRLRHLGGEVPASGPIVVKIAGRRITIEPIQLRGRTTSIKAHGSADLATGEIAGSMDAVLSPGFGRNIPYPVQINEPISVVAAVSGQVTDPTLTLDITHPGGALVFRDPPLRIRDLVVSAEVDDGVLWINDGRARVNQGTMEIGGGWDPESRQGVVAEMENVVVFVGGILSQWSGAVAIEPQPDRLARVVGEVNLVAGLWDQNVSLGGAIFGAKTLDPASDDPLNQISLDLDVRGRGVVRVENNLGRFDARWDVLRLTGRAANPRINGEITIDPGGRFSLAGQRVKVRRGSLLFTGDPEIDPIVEIVPESDFGAFGKEEGQLNTTAMATQGLVEGIAGAFGFENETLQPADISVDLERDSSQQIMIGQRLSHSVALFFATNATDVQDRTSMLQFWNVPGLKGLSVQGYQKTLTEEIGGNVFQRFQWGGSSLYDDRPTIRKLKLNGEWPIRKRGLKKATGFRRGQPFDPFLEFVARVRMERKLAVSGYQEARITTESLENNNSWILNFECDPGPFQEVIFEGDAPPRRIREEVTALYRHPPLESFGFRNMASLLERHFDVEGYPDASIVVERRDDRVVVEVAQKGQTELTGPVIAGIPDSVSTAMIKRLGKPNELALLAEDQERAIRIVEAAFADLGYRSAKVHSVQMVPLEAERAEVRIGVDLGEQTVVGRLVVTGSDPLGLTRSDDFRLAIGKPLDRMSVDLAASQIRAEYDAAGYSDAIARGATEVDEDGEVTVTINVEPGIQRILEGVVVNGLKHTSRRSIVSGVTIEEGEILTNSDLDTTAARVANFAPIERVDVRTTPKGSSGAQVELDIFEKPRWTTEVGGGWSSERGVQARFGVKDDNLFGRGFGLNFRGRWDNVEWLGFVVASLPPMPGKRLSFTSTLGFSRGEPDNRNPILLQDESSWSIDGTRWLGGGERAAGTAGEYVTAYYRFTRAHIYEREPDPDAIIPIDITNDIGLIGARYVRDRFDSPFDPTSGYGVFVDLARSTDLLGSDFEYWTGLGTGSIALPVLGSSTLIQSARIGVAEPLQGEVLRPTVRLFAGGQGSVRGFDRNSLGPVSLSIGGTVEPKGGGALFILNEELRIPVWGSFRAAVFADIGQVWESWGEADFDLSVGAGVGVRWATPIGPLWADVAWPLVNTGISSTKPKFYIGIGRPF